MTLSALLLDDLLASAVLFLSGSSVVSSSAVLTVAVEGLEEGCCGSFFSL